MDIELKTNKLSPKVDKHGAKANMTNCNCAFIFRGEFPNKILDREKYPVLMIDVVNKKNG